ncbi:MAG: peptidoglycan-binding protein [Pedobacter sp.]|nr:MAG: peptidoglycan-binding protein [Pedobacter sp.]
MAKIKIIFLAICGLTGFSWVNNSSSNIETLKGKQIVQIAYSQVGVRELTGNNDGPMVEEYLHYTKLSKGHPWCAAFVSWVYRKAGFSRPCTPWSPALFPTHRLSKKVSPGIVYGLYDHKKGRIVHCGIATGKESDWVLGIEGNTNVSGSADGDGVYLKRRHTRSLHAMANWIH